MKNKILILLLFAIPLSLNAQLISNYGIKAGIVSSRAAEVSAQNYYPDLYKDSRASGSFSIFAQFLNSDFFRFEAELGYKQEGAEDKIPVTSADNPDGTGEYIIIDHAYDFLSLNISLHPKFENEDLTVYGIIAPELKYMLKNRDQILLDQDLKKFTLGYNIGFGIQPKGILNGKLFAEIKYGSSFTKYLKNDYMEAKFNTLQISIGSYIN